MELQRTGVTESLERYYTRTKQYDGQDYAVCLIVPHEMETLG